MIMFVVIKERGPAVKTALEHKTGIAVSRLNEQCAVYQMLRPRRFPFDGTGTETREQSARQP